MNITYCVAGNGFALFVNGRFIRTFKNVDALFYHAWDVYGVDPVYDQD